MSTPIVGRVRWLAGWSVRRRCWLATWCLLAGLAWLLNGPAAAVTPVVAAVTPGFVGCAWAGLAPASYEALVAGPSRRVGWWWFARRRWKALARVCGLADRQVARVHYQHGKRREEYRWVAPRLRRVRVRGSLVELTIRARPGQTLEELMLGAERLATTFAAVSHRARPVSGCVVVVDLVMRDVLTGQVTACEPDPRAVAERVRLGRTQAGDDWWLQLRGRHTLVAGCSGAGKGSVLWGVCCGLAPAVRTDLVRLWGIDLKRGVELAMGESLFTTRAYTPAAAVEVLRTLMEVIDERGDRMAGTTRLHEPVIGDPLHVLVIDELAALTAYADLEVRREATRLLSEVLTQGRALGVVVLACVQDPRKDVVAMRGLFTQTVALRLRSAEETVMVLGDGMAQLAPAHRISPSYPGTAWVVDDTGAGDRVRADYWPDPLIREVAARYAATVEQPLSRNVSVDDDEHAGPVTPRPHRPRTPRAPRAPRGGRVDVQDGAA